MGWDGECDPEFCPPVGTSGEVKPTLIVFTKKWCPNCPLAKKVARKVADELGLMYKEVNIDDDILTALRYSVASTPSIVLAWNDDYDVLFRSEVPSEEELRASILQHKVVSGSTSTRSDGHAISP